jgi:hypothetical protein
MGHCDDSTGEVKGLAALTRKNPALFDSGGAIHLQKPRRDPADRYQADNFTIADLMVFAPFIRARV